MSILRRIESALALVWQIVRFSRPERLNITYIGAFIFIGVFGVTVAIFYTTSLRPLKISEDAAGESAAPETPKAPVAKEPGSAAPTGSIADPSRLGSRFPYLLPEKSPFERLVPTPDVAPNSKKEIVSPKTKNDDTLNFNLDRSPSSKMYETQIVFGPTNSTKTVFFFWSASSNESVSEFQKHILPLIRKISALKIQIVLSQVFDPKFHDANGSGAVLICPDKYADYVKSVVRYLSKASGVEKFVFDEEILLYKNSSIDRLVKDKIINLNDCKNSSAQARQILLYHKTNLMLSRFKTPPPIYVVKDIIYVPNDPIVNRLLLSR